MTQMTYQIKACMSTFILESLIAIEFHLVRQKHVTTNLPQNSFQNQGQTLKNHNSQYTNPNNLYYLLN